MDAEEKDVINLKGNITVLAKEGKLLHSATVRVYAFLNQDLSQEASSIKFVCVSLGFKMHLGRSAHKWTVGVQRLVDVVNKNE